MNKGILTTLLLAIAVTATAVAQEPIDRLRPSDGRNVIARFDVAQQGDTALVTGTVGTEEQREDIIACLLNDYTLYKVVNTDSLNVLELSVPVTQRRAQVSLAVATLRTAPRHAAEMATQAVMGTPLRVLQRDGEWLRVQQPDEYIAWIPESSVAFKSDDAMSAWRARHDRYVVTSLASTLLARVGDDEPVSDLVSGCILELRYKAGEWLRLATPDGREGYVRAEDVTTIDEWAAQAYDATLIERTARRMTGAGYLWGGTSSKVTDCSGLVKVCHLANGIILHRDASQQVLNGEPINDWHDALTGDLLFFGNKTTGRVTHVGIYLRDGNFIHCSGRVKVNNLDPDSPDYLYSPLAIRRVSTAIGTRGITPARQHPWYF